jgi:exopolysaccharide biosynthesis polyprenyl glycosylphosphotransferase
MLWRSPVNKRFAQLADALTVVLSFEGAYYFWHFLKAEFPKLSLGADIKLSAVHLLIVLGSIAVWSAVLNAQKAYSYQRFTSFVTEAKIVANAVLIGTLILLGAVFLVRVVYVPRTLIFLFAIVNLIFLIGEKLLLFYGAKIVRGRGYNRKRVLVVGTNEQTKEFVDRIEENFSWGLDIVGFLDAGKNKVGREVLGKKVLGTYVDLPVVLHSQPIDEVIVTLASEEFAETKEVLDLCEREGVQVRIVSDFLGKIAKRIRADVVYGLPVISIVPVPQDEWRLFIKRSVDIVGSLVPLVILSPVFLIIAIAIKLSSPGPVLYKAKWIGRNGRLITGYKFRTMVSNADELKKSLAGKNEMNGPVFKMSSDPRITSLGRVLRKFSFDELPQLWCVLKGDLSLVGPRPPLSTEVEKYESWHRRRLSIKPGLTCLWQVKGRSSIKEFDEWARLDLEYIDNWSLVLDMKILLKTIPVVLFGRNAH